MDDSIDQSIRFLDPLFHRIRQHSLARPWVTLTYAQSIDGFIAGEGGQQVRISGNESMVMTHLLRNNHDAILVGIGTLLNDNPRLTVRFPTDTKIAMFEIRHPRPIVLDSKLRIPLDCNLVVQPSSNNAFKSPWVITSHQRYELWNSSKLEGLSLKGVNVLQCDLDANGNLHLPDVLSVLYKEGVGSVMVEGGSQVIDSFLHAASAEGSGFLRGSSDAIVTTVSPNRLCKGVSVGDNGSVKGGMAGLWRNGGVVENEVESGIEGSRTAAMRLGNDTVFLCVSNKAQSVQ